MSCDRARTSILAGTAAFVALLATTCASAVDMSQRVEFDIPAGKLSDALIQFSRQAQVQVLASGERAASAVTGGVTGARTLSDALNELLRLSGFEFDVMSNNAIAVHERPSASPAANYDPGASSSTSGDRAMDPSLRLAQAGVDQDADAENARLQRRQQELSAVSSGQEASTIDEVVVTGTYIQRTVFDMPTPVTVVSREDIQRSGFGNIYDVLLQVPALGVGLNSSTSQFSDDAGASFLNLRGLGIGRTLTLINGRRRVSGSATASAVDLSTIPAGMIERVEIVSGGASATYGADAVTGAVNIILKDSLEGLEASTRIGRTQDGGAESFTADVYGGTTFAEERGSIGFAVSFTKDGSLFARQRSFANNWLTLVTNPANTGPADGIPDQITREHQSIALLHPGGTFDIGGVLYTADPSLRALQIDPATGFGINGDGWDFTRFYQLRAESQALSARTQVRYELTQSTRLFFEVDVANTRTASRGAPQYDFAQAIQRDNPFVGADLGALMDANGLSQIAVFKGNAAAGARDSDIDRNTFTAIAGLDGQWANDWQWEVSYQYGRYDQDFRMLNRRILSRYSEALDAIADPVTGQPICRSAAARAQGCLAYNLLGAADTTPGAANYFLYTQQRDLVNEQTVSAARLTGTLMELPAGPLKLATGVEYRKETLSVREDGLATLGYLDSYTPALPDMQAESAVSEGLVELVAPLMKDRTLVHNLTVEGAARFSHYDSIGDTLTWKLGSTWAPVPSLNFRVTRARSIRAPNLNELYEPVTENIWNIWDPCEPARIVLNANRVANCQALGLPAGWSPPIEGGTNAVLLSGGSADLKEETSDTWTAGAVFTPTAIAGLQVSLDYWKIRIRGAIEAIDYSYITDRCVDLPSVDNVFCPLTQRQADGTISFVDTRAFNIGGLLSDGVDLQLAYRLALASISENWPGHVGVTVNATYTHSHEELVDATDPNTVLLRAGSYLAPKLRGNINLYYRQGALGVSLDTRYIGQSRVDMNHPTEYYDRPRVSTKIYNDLFASYDIGERLRLYGGINNLLATEPPATEATYLGRDGFYDSLGRAYSAGISARF